VSAGDALWRALAAGADVPAPSSVWDDLLAGDRVMVGPLLVPTARRSTWWNCGKAREDCVRRLVDEGPRYAAVCDDPDWRCPTVTMPPSATFLHEIQRPRLLAALRAGLALTGDGPVDVAGGSTALLGTRALGDATVRAYFAPNPEVTAVNAVAADAGDGRGTLVLVTAGAPDKVAAALALSRGIDVRPLGAWATLIDGGGVVFDLDGFVLTHRFSGLDPSTLLSTRKRLILDPVGRRVWLDGKPVAVPRAAPYQWNFLIALARRAGKPVLRPALALDVWRDEYAAKAKKYHDFRTYLRQRREDLDKAATWPISDVRGGDDDGGYQLDLQEHEVAWWSDPPPIYKLRLQK
jgi:hypothetical protein